MLQLLQWYGVFLTAFIGRMLIAFLWILYVHNKWPKLDPLLVIPAGVGFVADIILNYCVTLLCFDPPRKWQETVSSRFGRYLVEPRYTSNWFNRIFRSGIANIFCPILSSVDKHHCIKAYNGE